MKAAESNNIDVLDLLDEGVIAVHQDGMIRHSNIAADRLLGLSVKSFSVFHELLKALGDASDILSTLQDDDSGMLVIGGSLIEAKRRAAGDQYLIVLTDRSEELRWQSQLAEQGHMLSTNTEAFLVVEQTGSVRYANNFCELERGYGIGEMLGLKLNEIEIGRDVDGVSSRVYSDEEMAHRLSSCVKKGQAIRYEAWHVRNDGSIFPTDVTLRPYRMSNDMVLLLTARDETERFKQLQALIEARAEAESSNKAKSAFMAVTSHELRTPLTTVIGFLELLKLDYGEGHGDLSNYLDMMHKSSTSLLRLIEDILDFTKIEAQTLKLEMRSINLESYLARVQEQWQLAFKNSPISFRFEKVGELSQNLRSDPVRLSQLLDNLIGNAKKFTNSGEVCLRVERRDQSYVFHIIDTGCGIEEPHLERIFDPFYQVEDSMTRQADGTGLGLYICKNLCAILGGSIEIERSDQSGTHFVLSLPIQ